ncbi:nucleolar protein dao-5-like [Thrips palmi]|uniref:Nucleolar protein dao-5-like n=1 Tax=Thrips palmi TaxID=161013 RepID=A0A6P8YJH1_THRPL|nr:nucleolar protein dao-5-like [Thrips palmi]XP_034239997.1 nucleolar protein dao-5-like [Thrips palmi]
MIHGYIIVRKRSGSDGPQYPVKKSLKIGRGTHCDIRIHVQSVSEQHCLVLVEQGKRAHIQNLSATSQTVVNGVSIGKGAHPLNHGDSVCVGERSFQWHYAPGTPFFEGQKVSPQKRRRSETDSGVGSQNIAVVNPLFHKRRTISVAESRSPKVLLKHGAPADLKETPPKSTDDVSSKVKTPKSSVKTTPARMSLGKTPKSRQSAANTPKAKTPVAFSPKEKTPLKVKTPKSRTPVSSSPAAKTPRSAMKTPALKTPVVNSPALKSPARKTPGRKASVSKIPVVSTPALMSPVSKTPGRKASVSKTPVVSTPALMSPVSKTPGRKASVSKTPVANSPALKSPGRKTPGPKASVSKTPIMSPKARTPGAKSSRKSKSVSKSAKSTKGLKRKLSSASPVASKRLKIESPKSIDKKKMAVLMGIHGKSPRVASSSTLSSVKLVLSAKKTPVIKAIKTPRSSTVKKSTAKSSVKKNLTKSSVKQARRPLFSEVLKRKAVQRANTAVKKLTLVPRAPPKAGAKKAEKAALSMEIPKHFKFGSTGHANSPETIFISKKVTKTPVVTKKGRKENLLVVHQKEAHNLSGVGALFKTPAKGSALEIPTKGSSPKTPAKRNLPKTPAKRSSLKTPATTSSPTTPAKGSSPKTPAKRSSLKTPATTSSPTTPAKGSSPKTPAKRSSLKTPAKRSSPNTSGAASGNKIQRLSTNPKESPANSSRRSITRDNEEMLSKKTPIKPASPPASPKNNSMSPGRSATRSSSGKSSSGRSPSAPQSALKSAKKAPRMSSSKKSHELLTSTPAVLGKRQSFAESAFESPSALLTGHISAPQSPASGRKSRMEMVMPRTPYIHSPHASPSKSSLKSSPTKSPPSGQSRNLSVSFNDNIHIQVLLPGSRKSLSSTASLSSPASPRSEGNSGAATPDITTFDFNSIKTPNVPHEMFVSSILSSGASSSSQASGSAKRKGRPPKTPQHDVTNLQGVRRLLKTPSSPPGYVDVKGVKRLMTAECKTPTYLAVEGVKKLFGEASAAAGNDLSSFAGVRELFASPSPSRRFPSKGPSKATPRKTSPVAKIQAEVESKGISSVSPSKPVRRSVSDTTEREVAVVSPNRSRITLVLGSRRASLKTGSEQPSSSPTLTPVVSEEKIAPKRGRGRKVQPTKTSEQSVNTVSSPRGIEPLLDSPPKRRTRKAAKAATPLQKSPAGELPKPRGRTKRTAPESSPAVAELPLKPVRKNARSAKATSPARKVSTSPVKSMSPNKADSPVKATSRRTRKTVVAKSPSPVKISPAKRTRRGVKAATAVASPVKSKSYKRSLSPSKEIESPLKKAKKDSPEKSPAQKVATRRTRKNASPTPQASPKPKPATPGRKRKAVTFEDDATPQKKDKPAKVNVKAESPEVVSPKATRAKKAVNKKSQPAKKASPKRRKATSKAASPAVSLSPRKTRSRK